MALKRYTNYRCMEEGCGKGVMWTGALAAYRPGDELCGVCRQPYTEVVKDGRIWRVTFEMVSPFTGEWRRVDSDHDNEHSARAQLAGLRQQMSEGEPVRNPGLAVTEQSWSEVTP